MLRHKAAIQAIRYAFGFSGIVDPDEADRMRVNVTVNHHHEPTQHRRFAGPALPAPVEDNGVEHFDAAEIEAEANAR